MWRRAFHAEAMDCVNAMQAVVDRTKSSHFATRFDDWRKVDLKATAQVQMHVKELTRLNQSVEQFLHECGSLTNLAEFQDSFLALNQCVSELTEAKREITASIDAVAERAAAKVASAWQAEAREAAERRHERWATDGARWGHLEARVSELQGEVRELGDAVRGDLKSSLEAVKDHMADIFRGSGGLSFTLESLDKRMGDWEAATNTELALHRTSAEQLRQQVAKLEDAGRGAARRHAGEEEAWREAESSLQGQVLGLQAELYRAQEALRDARTSSWRGSLHKVKEIDARGNLQLNRQNGQVRFVGGVDFTPCKPTQKPTPDFSHPAAVQRAATDLVELAALFGGPVSVEVHLKPGKGGTPAFWEDLAEAQAALLRSELERGGIPADRLAVKGFAGRQGQNLNTVLVKLDQDLFSEHGTDGHGKPDSKRPPPSPRARSPVPR